MIFSVLDDDKNLNGQVNFKMIENIKYGNLENALELQKLTDEYVILDDTKYDTLDCTNGTPEEIARKVLEWLRKQSLKM